MKKLLILSTLLISTSLFAKSKIFTSVSLNVDTVNAPSYEYCVVQIFPPEIEGYKFVNARDRGSVNERNSTTSGTLQAFLSSHEVGSRFHGVKLKTKPEERYSDFATKSLKTRVLIRNISDNSVSTMERVVSANVSYSDYGVSDHSVLSLNNLMPYSEDVNAALLFMPSIIDSSITKWNDLLKKMNNKRHAKKTRKTERLTDLKVTSALNVVTNAELILLSQYACEDKKEKIERVEISKYLSKLTSAFNMLNN